MGGTQQGRTEQMLKMLPPSLFNNKVVTLLLCLLDLHINDVYLALLTGNIRNFNICLSAGQEFKYCAKLVHFTLNRVLATSKLYQRQQLVGAY